MGGHGHDDHHHEPYTVPKPEIYKIEDAEQLVYLQNELAKRGLKDPWARNEVWRFTKNNVGSRLVRPFKFFFRGLPLGFAAFLATIAYEEYAGVYKDDHSHGHGHGGYYGDSGHH